MSRAAKLIVVIAALVLAGPAVAQLRGLPGAIGSATQGLPSVGLPSVSGIGQVTETLSPRGLADLRLRRLLDVVRDNRRALDVDDAGDPVVRAEVLATAPSPAGLSAAQSLGFLVLRRDRLEGLDLELVTLQAPGRMSLREALRKLTRADPTGSYDYNHLYFIAAEPRVGQAGIGIGSTGAIRLGLIDTGLEPSHPSLAAASVQRQGFAPGGYRPAGHGLAVASLTGAGKGAVLYSADVYGAGPTGGSAEAVVRALAWMAEVHAPVVNISLVGPANRPLQAAIEAVQKRGGLVVAAVGNDGPAAPATYPASYPGVVAVTGVDRRGKVLLEAGRASHLDFAAPGADIAAAQPSGYAGVRGTSFAAPIVAGRLAMLILQGSRDPVTDLARLAQAAGKVERAYGRGLVGAELLTAQR